MNPIDYFDQGWSIRPKAVCLRDVSNGITLSYSQTRDLTLRCANTLLENGYGIGAKIAVLSANSAHAFVAVLSILRTGATWLPINPRNAPDEVALFLNRFGCEVLFYQSAYSDAVDVIRKTNPNIRHYICLDQPAVGAPFLLDWCANGDLGEIQIENQTERVFAIQPTGGTTGLPKGVSIPSRSLEVTVASFAYCFPPKGVPVFLAVAPITHAAGMVAQSIMAFGGEIVMYASVETQLVMHSIAEFGITHTFLPPTVIYDLLNQPNVHDFDYSTLQYLIYGAAPMAPDRLREALDVFGPCMAQIYSQTEMAVPATFLAPQDHFIDGEIAPDSRLKSCGRASAFVRVEVQDENGVRLPDGEVGEICMAGTGRMLGYYQNPEATSEVIRNGWLLTGDVGFRDPEGYFHITDRKKDMIITGGFNVFSVEVEHMLHSHAAIAECSVFGLPDAKWGEAISAAIVLKPGADLSEAEVIAFAKANIGSLKSPKQVYFYDALPKSPVGKVLKRELRKQLSAPKESQT